MTLLKVITTFLVIISLIEFANCFPTQPGDNDANGVLKKSEATGDVKVDTADGLTDTGDEGKDPGDNQDIFDTWNEPVSMTTVEPIVDEKGNDLAKNAITPNALLETGPNDISDVIANPLTTESNNSIAESFAKPSHAESMAESPYQMTTKTSDKSVIEENDLAKSEDDNEESEILATILPTAETPTYDNVADEGSHNIVSTTEFNKPTTPQALDIAGGKEVVTAQPGPEQMDIKIASTASVADIQEITTSSFDLGVKEDLNGDQESKDNIENTLKITTETISTINDRNTTSLKADDALQQTTTMPLTAAVESSTGQTFVSDNPTESPMTEEDFEPHIAALKESSSDKMNQENTTVSADALKDMPSLSTTTESSIEDKTKESANDGPVALEVTSAIPNLNMASSKTTTTNSIDETTTSVVDDENKPLLQPVKSLEEGDSFQNVTTAKPLVDSPVTSINEVNATAQRNKSIILLPNPDIETIEAKFDVKMDNDTSHREENEFKDNLAFEKKSSESDEPTPVKLEVVNITLNPPTMSSTKKIPYLLDLEKEDKDKAEDGSGEVDGDDDKHDHHSHGKDHDHDDHHTGATHGDTPEDRENKKRTAIIVGVAVGGVALFTLGFFTTRHCKKHSREHGQKTKPVNGDTIEFVPLNTSHPGIYDDMEARNPNGLYRQGPKMGPPSPRMHRKNEGKFEFPEPRKSSSSTLEIPKKNEPSSLSDEPFLSKQVDKIKYMDESTDDELDASPRDRLLHSNNQSPDTTKQTSQEDSVVQEEAATPNGLGSHDVTVA